MLGLDDLLHDAVGAAEVDREGRADAELALDADVATALLDDPVHGRQPQPVPLPASLVVKKGSKIWRSVASSIPWPLSRTVSVT